MIVLAVNNLAKYYGTKMAFEDVSFNLNQGESIGIIGPNGSGKTTLLNTLTSMLKPSQGSFAYAGDLNVGISISRKGFFDDMTVLNNMQLFIDQNKISATNLREFAIDFEHSLYKTLSAGMKQRVSIAIPFLQQNDLLLLDEPTNHLDIDSILNLRSKILHLKSNGVSFIITSHQLTDIETTCDRIIFMVNGRIAKNDLTKNLIANFGSLESAYLSLRSATPV